jgi:CheY-like chemotaxis protein
VRLTQILNNLVSNAIKFTEQGKINVAAMLQGEEEDSVLIRFAVADTGIGIPADRIDYIFDSFTQANTDTTRKYGGTGLGLAITRRLLELQGSQIYVKSEVNKGSTFYFTLSFYKSHHFTLDPQQSFSLIENNDLSHIRLLLVEDNEFNQIVASKFLQKWNIVPDYAADGLIALEKASVKEYDIILMDLQMPQMNGYEATRAIRHLPNLTYKHIPIIALTADVIADVKEKAVNAGMTDFITKPFNPEDLYAKLLQYSHSKPVLTQANDHTFIHKGVAYRKINELAAGDTKFKNELFETCRQTLLQFKADYKKAVLEKDGETMHALAHKIKTIIYLLEANFLLSELEKTHQMVENAATTTEQLYGSIAIIEHICDSLLENLPA